MFSNWAEKLESKNLVFHMLPEHAAFILGGALISYSIEHLLLGILTSRLSKSSKTLIYLYTKMIQANYRFNWHGLPSAIIIAIIIAYWHTPEIFNQAVLDGRLHAIMHLSYIGIGVMAFLLIKVTSRVEKGFLALALGKTMLIGGQLLINPLHYFYTTYPIEQQIQSGLLMIIIDPIVVLIIVIYTVSYYLNK